MPQRTALRRGSTVVVGVLFAVAFVCSGASATHAVAKSGKSAVSVHTSTSKAAARTFDAPAPKHNAPAPLHLATTGPVDTDEAPTLVVDTTEEQALAVFPTSDFTTSERAPPAP